MGGSEDGFGGIVERQPAQQLTDLTPAAYELMERALLQHASLTMVSTKPYRVDLARPLLEQLNTSDDEQSGEPQGRIIACLKIPDYRISSTDIAAGSLEGMFSQMAKSNDPPLTYDVVRQTASYSSWDESYYPTQLAVIEQYGDVPMLKRAGTYKEVGLPLRWQEDSAQRLMHRTQVDIFPSASLAKKFLDTPFPWRVGLSGHANRYERRQFRSARREVRRSQR